MSHWSFRNIKTGDIWEAYQFIDETGQNTTAYPRWFLDLLLDNRIEAKGDLMNHKWFFDRETRINDHDWIIRDSLARIFIVPNDRFQIEFEREPK